MKIGDIVVNVDGYIGKVVDVAENKVTMKFKKAVKFREETWDTDYVRLANSLEIIEYVDALSTKGETQGDKK